MVLGVSTRNYERSLDPAPSSVRTRGTSKNAVSRRFVGATRERLVEMMSRDLSTLPICAVMVDGIHVGDHLVLVALGIDEHGEKHVLAFYEGATENAATSRALLKVEVAVPIASRGFSGLLKKGTADEGHCQDKNKEPREDHRAARICGDARRASDAA
jgi:transposase-like protein